MTLFNDLLRETLSHPRHARVGPRGAATGRPDLSSGQLLSHSPVTRDSGLFDLLEDRLEVHGEPLGLLVQCHTSRGTGTPVDARAIEGTRAMRIAELCSSVFRFGQRRLRPLADPLALVC